MIVAYFVRQLRKLASRSERNGLDALTPTGPFRKVIERERWRSDRTGECLSLIAFAPRGSSMRQATYTCLARILPKRLRSTDEIGWLDDEQIACLLPSTSAEGAWKAADAVCLTFPDDVPPPICTVYSYPERSAKDWPSLKPSSEPKRAGAVIALESLLIQPLPVWKRGVDILGAAAGLLLSSPLLVVLAGAIKLTSPGPVFFRQWRSGRGGKPFLMYKFRSMACDAEARKQELRQRNEQDGPAFKMANDPRVTPLGRFLRQTSLDELPQLWNVFKGDMSLVGPRPLPCDESAACAVWQRRRLDATPGLTCIWQVRGRGRVAFADWVRMDVEYMRNLSLWQDLKLLVLTIPAVLLRRGAH